MQDADLWTLPGLGGELQKIYMQTAHVPDIRFSWAAVISLFSVICSRKYRTPSRNYTPITMMILARSSSGKNHILSFIGDCLKQSGLSHLCFDPTGCASKQGLFSILKRCPSQIVIIDESGHVREAGKDNPHTIGLKGAIMSMVSNNEGSFSLPATSERGMSEKDREIKREYERPIQHPALTYIEISTAEKLLKQISPEDIDSGELGRYIILTDNNALPELTKDDPPAIDLPDHIRQALFTLRYNPADALTEEQAYNTAKAELWQAMDTTPPDVKDFLTPTDHEIKAYVASLKESDPGFISNTPDNPNRPPLPIVFEWEDAGLREEIFLTRQRELLEKYWKCGNSIHSKKHEIAMRLSLIYSLMDTECHQSHTVSREHALQVMKVINHLIDQTDRQIVPQIASSDVQRATQVAVGAIKAADGQRVTYEAWKGKAAWKTLDSTTKKMSVLDSLLDFPVIAIKNEDTVRSGKFNANSYVWIGDDSDLEEVYQEFKEIQQEEAKV